MEGDLKAVDFLPPKFMLTHNLLPLREENGSIILAAAKIPNAALGREIRFFLNRKFQIEEWDVVLLKQEIQNRLGVDKISTAAEEMQKALFTVDNSGQPRHTVPAGDVVSLVNDIVSRAILLKASDIHIEGYENRFRVRIRMDGKLVEMEEVPLPQQAAVVSRIKIMAGMDIAEKRRPQDGRIRMKGAEKAVDIRVSTLPTGFGEKVVLRILDKSAVQLSLDVLGIRPESLLALREVLAMPYGLILVTGPTGSGKTTTLYAALNELNQSDTNIITIEDPIEYHLNGINQTMVRADLGLSFPAILRTVLRQDPNVIMIGEIRDKETAEIAVRAALTGHLVLSTLHTNSAAGSIFRLVDMGVEPFLIAAALKLVLAQRLVRKICPNCRSVEEIPWQKVPYRRLSAKLRQHQFYAGKGCDNCFGTGFKSREAVVEFLKVNDELSTLIQNNKGLLAIKNYALEQGMLDLSELGVAKAKAGKTSLGEAIRETMGS